jgi:2-haloacid dehalogenase
MHGVKFLGFDVFGTVVDWRSSVARELAPFLQRHGLGHLDPASVADEWRGLYQPSMETIRRGDRPWVRLTELNRESLGEVLRRHQLDTRSIAEQELTDLNRAWERLNPWPDSVPGLTQLYQLARLNGDFCGLLAGKCESNQWGAMTKRL